MAREAAKSKALQPRGEIQSRLEKQKAKAKSLGPASEIDESKSTSDDTKQINNDVDVIVQDDMTHRSADTQTVREVAGDRVSEGSTDVPRQKRRGRGRPANEVGRTALTLRPNDETVKRLRVYAAENGYSMSDVVDVLVELFLNSECLVEQLAKSKGRKKL